MDEQPSTTRNTAQTEDQTLCRSTRLPALRCYTCGEPCHLQTSCHNQTRHGLISEGNTEEQLPIYHCYGEEDTQEDGTGELMMANKGHSLVVRRSCMGHQCLDELYNY